jgi:hypothetical protein
MISRNAFFGAAAAILLCLTAASCVSTSYRVGVDGIGSTPAGEKTYVISPTDTAVKTSDLRFQEFAAYVEKALKTKGYERVSDAAAARLVVYLTYGVGNPERHTYTYPVPLTGQTGVKVSTSKDPANPNGAPITTYEPLYGIVGYEEGRRDFTTYYKFIKIEAFDLKSMGSGNEVQYWSTILTNEDESPDLRLLFPRMIAAGFPYIGTNTGKALRLSVSEKDKTLESLIK